MIVIEYAKQRSLRKLLDSKYSELDWASKVVNLYFIANGLDKIHQAKLVYKNFHSGNIVNQNMFSSYITDFGLCKPVLQDSNSKELFGMLLHIVPLCDKFLLDSKKAIGFCTGQYLTFIIICKCFFMHAHIIISRSSIR